MRTARPIAIAVLAFSALASGSVRAAEPSSPAEKLDADGRALMEERRYAEACPKLAESDRLKPGTGVMLRLALCYERLGKTASALAAYRIAAARAQVAGDDTLRRLATKRAGEIEPRVPSVEVRLPRDVDRDAIDVQCDGVAIDRAALAGPIRLDPGSHALQVAARGYRTFRKSFVLVDGASATTIDVDLPPSDDRKDEPPPSPTPSSSSQHTLAYVAGGVGVVGVGVGSVFGLVAMSNWNRARGECTSGTAGCSADALSLESTVRSQALVSTIAFGVGAAGLVGAAILFWSAPRNASGVAWSVGPTVDGGRVGASVGGRF
jgi:hypothetical protein